MTADNGRRIYDYLVREVRHFLDHLDEGYELGLRIGGFGTPTLLLPGSMAFHVDGLINFSGEDETGKPKEIFLAPHSALIEMFASPIPGGSKQRQIGFEVIKK